MDVVSHPENPPRMSKAKEQEDLIALKSRFLANLSHEFRTPLTLILGPTEILLSKTTDPDTRLQLERIRRNSQKLLRLINQLLDLSKIEAGQINLRFAQQDIGRFCLQVASAFESLAEQRNIALQVHAEPDQYYLYFDAEKLEHVLNNLLSNALKFSERGSVTLDVRPSSLNPSGFIEISVTDTGIGIHPDKLPHIFDRFYQASEHAGLEYEGTGIGLALCKELAELHSGRIDVRSTPGHGSTFTLSLPRGRAHLTDEQIIPQSTYEPGRLTAFVSSVAGRETLAEDTDLPDILIVDDNKDMLDFLTEQLNQDFDVLRAINGKEALEIAFERTPDIVISDVMMPVMNGFELCHALKTDLRTDHIPVILLTARVGHAYKIEGFQAAADDYIQKPFSADELRTRIVNLLHNRHLLRKKYAQYMLFDPAEIADSPGEAAFLTQLNNTVEERLSDTELDVGTLSTVLGMSRSQLNRKLKALTGRSPNDYIRTYRLEKARVLLEKGGLTVSEVAYDVGFSSPAYFSKCFRDAFGFSPSEAGNPGKDINI